jgi:hypothetical protein
MKKIVVARSWREFQSQQGASVYSLYQIFSQIDVHLHICANSNIDWDLVNDLRISMPNWKINIYTVKFLNDYAKKRGAKENQIEKFENWKWIYHLILYHYLWHVIGEDYILTYDDDIFFKEFPGEVMHKIDNRIPFCMVDQYSDSDKPMMGKLVLKFGNWIHDEYYSCWGSTWSSNSGFMGLLNKEIFEQFKSPEEFREMLDMFEYREYRHEDENIKWDDYKILLQEQSFLGILNRAFSRRRHEVLTPEYGYLVWDPASSKVQHYVAKAKFKNEFAQKIKKQFSDLTHWINSKKNENRDNL